MIFILDRNETVLAVLNNNGSPNSCPYYSDSLKENLDTGTSTYEFTVPATHEVVQNIQEGGYVAFNNLDGELMMFTIMELQETHSDTSELYVYCENAGLELLNDIVRPRAFEGKDAQTILDSILLDTRWEKGHVDYLGVEDVIFEDYVNTVEALRNVAETFGGELNFRVVMKNGKVYKRFVDLVKQRGSDTKKRFTFGKDIQSIRRTVDMTNVVTALIGIGSEGLDFKDFGYYPSQGDAYYKPKNQDWVGDPEALDMYGQQGKHIFGTFTYETTEPKTLLDKTWEELQRRKKPEVTYELDVALLARLANLDAESVRLGDTVYVVDESFEPALYLEARVRELDTSFSDPTQDKCVLGNFKNVQSNITAQMREIQNKLLRKEATWDSVKDILDVTEKFEGNLKDENFENGTEYWTERPEGEKPPESSTGITFPSPEETEFGTNLIQFEGETMLFSKNAMPVNTNRTYRVTIRIRQSKNPSVPGRSKVSAGVACLNGTFTDLTNGLHRFCAVQNEEIVVEDGWQMYTGLITGTGSTPDTFAEGTKYVRPMFLVNFQDGDGTAEIDYLIFEDVTEIVSVQGVVNEIDMRTTADSIVQTVRQDTEYLLDLGSKSDKQYVDENFVDNAKLEGTTNELLGQVDSKIDKLQVPAIVSRVTQVEQRAGEIDFKFTNSGGVNLLRNSVGYAGGNFWTQTYGTPVQTIQNEELKAIGAGSGWYAPVGSGYDLSQTVSVVNAKRYTLSFYLSKTRDNATNGHAGVEIWAGGKKVTFVGKESGKGNTQGFQKFTYNLSTELTEIKVVLSMGINAEATITNLMLNIGDVPLQWTLGSGEVYNTNVLMDMNGLRVNSSEYDGYTVMSPKEFSGYAETVDETTGVTSVKRVFSLNKDTTEVEKLQARSDVSMAPMRIVPVRNDKNTGWAFVPFD